MHLWTWFLPAACLKNAAAELGAPTPRIGPVDELLDEWLLEADHFEP
jgi:hypothetical protein